jgi:hypothetical protein
MDKTILHRRASVPGAGLASGYFVFVVFCFAMQSIVATTLALLVTVWLLLCYLKLLTGAEGLDRVLLVVVALTLTASLPVAVMRNSTAIAHYFVVLATMGAAYLFTRDLSDYFRASRTVLLVIQATVGLYLLTAGLDDYPLESMIPGSSSNGITSYLVLLQVNYCIARFLYCRQVAWVTPFLTLAICVVGYGRGSLLASAAICLINFWQLLPSTRRLRIGLLVAGLALLLFSVAGGWTSLWTFVEGHTKLGGGVYDSARASIIEEYLSRMDVFSLFVGEAFDGTAIDTQFRGNPHNSFIRAHHIFGLPYLLLFLLLPWCIFNTRRKWREAVFLFLMFTVLVFRAATETIVFPTLLDLFFFAICFACQRDAVVHGRLAPGHRGVELHARSE